jgi:hypothetical protein
VSPWFDLVFVVNVGWLGALAFGAVVAEGLPEIEFWQIYFLTTPHRWITLFLVATDRDRRGDRTRWFVAIAAVSAIVVAAVWATTGQFLCLAMIDYVWNAWHFGAQHGGILRIYSRRAGGGRPRLETWSVRLLVVYAALRVAAGGWLMDHETTRTAAAVLDGSVLALAGYLLVSELVAGQFALRMGKLAYLASVVSLYGSLVLAARYDAHRFLAPLVVGSAAFHATEYLAIVSYYAWRRKEQGSAALFQELARRWGTVLLVFVLAMAVVSISATRRLPELWIGLNLWAAYLHYAYDGLIWKLRRPETAQALGAESPAGTSPQPAAS